MVETGNKPRRRWFQFSLRALLVLTALAAAGAWAWRAYLEPYRKQRQTLALIQELRGSCETAEAPRWLRRLFGGDLQNIALVNLADCDEPAKYLDHVAALPELEMLAVGGPAFGDEELRRLQKLKTLQGLVLDSTSVTPEGVAAFRVAMPDVDVHLGQRRAVAALRKVGDIAWGPNTKKPPTTPLQQRFSRHGLFTEAVAFRGNLGIQDDDLPHLKHLVDLHDVDLRYMQVISDVGMAHVASLPKLAWLFLDSTQVTDAGLEHLKTLPRLKWLSLTDTRVTDNGLAHLDAIPELERLGLGGTNITDAGLPHLKKLRHLRELNLASTRITDFGLKHLEVLTKLESVDLSSNNVGNAALPHLKSLTKLRSLDLNDTRVTDEGLLQLHGLSELAEVGLFRTRVTDVGLLHLRSLKKLSVVRAGYTQVTTEGVNQLRRVIPQCKVTGGFD